jgi:hypothetical protein
VTGRHILLTSVLVAAALATAIGSRVAAGQRQDGCAARPTATLSPDLPSDVCIPGGFSGIAVEYFDDYSWRAFVALIWPAAAPQRGLASRTSPVSAPGPRVFETYKPLWEIFHRDGSAPEADFARYDAGTHAPCEVSPRFGELIMGSHSGIDDIGQGGIGALDAPLVAQNGRYVRTLTFFNQVAFDHIVADRLYLRSAIPSVPSPRPDRPVVDFPIGSVAVKTAWLDITALPPALVARLYTRPVMLRNATGSGCAPATMGLVGMHIAQKTPSRPQWIWSSFEHEDLVPPAWPGSPGSFVLHDGTDTPMPAANPLSLVPLAPEPVRPFNVVRDPRAPILTRTDLTNYAYQALLADTPWRHYRVVVTQWPRLEGNQANPIPASVDGSVANTFPGTGAFSAFANLTMETFNQHSPQVGCMSCHNRARMTADFMWSVLDHAYPARLAPAPERLGPGVR